MPAARSAIERLARRVDDERATLERVAARPVRAIARNIRIAVLRAYARGQDPVAVIAREFGPLAIVVTDAMVAAHLVGRLRSVRAAESHGRERRGLGAYDSALRFVHERLNLTPENTAAIAGAYGNEAARVTRQASAAVERSAQRAVRDIVSEGMHVNEGIARLRQSMDAAGIPADKPWILETLVRTNIQMAYSAGRFQANQDPAIDAILWGYEYVTVGDDRVRPEHAALEGVRLAKDSPRLDPIWPPNGWQCRCTMLEIYVDDPAAQRTESYPDGPVEVNVDGTPVTVIPGPDKGFAFNPGRVFRDVIPTNVGAKIPPPIQKKAKPPKRVPLKPILRPDPGSPRDAIVHPTPANPANGVPLAQIAIEYQPDKRVAMVSGKHETIWVDPGRLRESWARDQTSYVARGNANDLGRIPAIENAIRRGMPIDAPLADFTGRIDSQGRPIVGFTDGRHRAALLIERGKPFPISAERGASADAMRRIVGTKKPKGDVLHARRLPPPKPTPPGAES